MNLTARLRQNPFAYKKGKRKVACLRKYAGQMAASLEAAISFPHLPPGADKAIQVVLARYRKNPNDARNIMALWGVFAGATNRYMQQQCVPQNWSELHSKIISNLRMHPDRKNWIIFRVDPMRVESYRYQIEQEYGYKPAMPNWLPHISVVRGETKRGPGEIIRSESDKLTQLLRKRYSVTVKDEIKKAGSYFYLEIESPELEHFRESVGLPSQPTPTLHLTIGSRPKDYK